MKEIARSGVYYVEFIDKASGKKLSARSTGETDKVKAQVKAELWKIQGIPTGRLGEPHPIEEAAGVEAVIRAELNPDDALRIVRMLKGMRPNRRGGCQEHWKGGGSIRRVP